ncbi:MAG: cytochrome c [Deltaproteobacteria bacterium]|nr:MAG: cytochrome c [Deltaproteobacteria bacterium]
MRTSTIASSPSRWAGGRKARSRTRPSSVPRSRKRSRWPTYVRHGCWQCHGFDGQGSIAGSKIAPNPLPFEAFSDFVRTTGGAMPPYQKAILSDEDLADIYAYLQSVPKARDPKTIPLLNP